MAFRTVDTKLWRDRKFLDLSDDARMIFLFLLTHPRMTMIGALENTVPGMAAEIRWDADRVTKALIELSKNGMVDYERGPIDTPTDTPIDTHTDTPIDTPMHTLPRWFRYHKLTNNKQLSGAVKALELMPECECRDRLVSRLREHLAKERPSLSKSFEISLSRSNVLAAHTPMHTPIDTHTNTPIDTPMHTPIDTREQITDNREQRIYTPQGDEHHADAHEPTKKPDPLADHPDLEEIYAPLVALIRKDKPSVPNPTGSTKTKWRDELRKLHELDGFEPTEILELVRAALAGELDSGTFSYTDKIGSIPALRRKWRNDLSKLESIRQAYRQKFPHQAARANGTDPCREKARNVFRKLQSEGVVGSHIPEDDQRSLGQFLTRKAQEGLSEDDIAELARTVIAEQYPPQILNQEENGRA